MALDITPGSATANSFATLDEFETYHENRYPQNTWFASATDDQKEAALIAAARELAAYFQWTGAAVDDVQALTWPRTGMLSRNNFPIPTSGATSIPIDLKNAQCEFAIQLGSGDLISENDPLEKGITSIRAGDVAVTFSDVKSKTLSAEQADVQVRLAQSELMYLEAPDEVRRLLVPSWYLQKSVRRGLLFQVAP